MSKFRKQHMSIDWHEIINDDSDLPAIKASLREKASLVGRLGSMMLSVGTSAWRVRASMNKISRALGVDCVADIGLMSIEYTCIENGEKQFDYHVYLMKWGADWSAVDEIDQPPLMEWYNVYRDNGFEMPHKLP